jgi:hypothetical protein
VSTQRYATHALTVLVLAVAIGASACSRRVTPPPPRPATVPADAVWAGGPDGGAFISCLAVGREPANTFECVVFGDRDGEVLGRGRFVTRPTFQVSLAELRRSYTAFDGSSILLANGAALAPDTTDVPFARPD